MNKSCLVIAVMFLISGCAFKESKGVPTPEIQKEKTPAFARQGTLQIQWVEEDKKPSPIFTRALTSSEPRAPLAPLNTIVVSRGVPEEVELTVSSQQIQNKTISRVAAQGRLSREGGIPSPLTVGELTEEPSASGTEWKIKLSGLDQLLSSTSESEAFISLKFFQDGVSEPVESIEVPLSTPPSKLMASQSPLNDFETKYGPLSDEKKTVFLGSENLKLLQVIQMKNQSSRSQSVKVPFKLNGKLETHYEKQEAVQSGCRFTISNSSMDDIYTNDIYYLNLADLNPTIHNNHFSIILQPGETGLVGIYGKGARVEELLANGHPKQDLVPTHVVDGCHSTCAPQNEGYWTLYGKALEYWKAQATPGDSSACVQLTFIMNSEHYSSCTWQWGPNQKDPEACNRCALWEISNGVAWNDSSKRFCIGTHGEGWQIERHYASVLTGIKSSPVYLRLASESTTFNSRFIMDGIDEVSPSRNFVNFVQPETVQIQ